MFPFRLQEVVSGGGSDPTLQADPLPLHPRRGAPGVATATHRGAESSGHPRTRRPTRLQRAQDLQRRRDTGRTAAHEKQVPVTRRNTSSGWTW